MVRQASQTGDTLRISGFRGNLPASSLSTRRAWDSNPRDIPAHWFSRPAPSAARTALQDRCRGHARQPSGRLRRPRATALRVWSRSGHPVAHAMLCCVSALKHVARAPSAGASQGVSRWQDSNPTIQVAYLADQLQYPRVERVARQRRDTRRFHEPPISGSAVEHDERFRDTEPLRSERDLNPRYPCGYTTFPGWRTRPDYATAPNEGHKPCANPCPSQRFLRYAYTSR